MSPEFIGIHSSSRMDIGKGECQALYKSRDIWRGGLGDRRLATETSLMNQAQHLSSTDEERDMTGKWAMHDTRTVLKGAEALKPKSGEYKGKLNWVQTRDTICRSIYSTYTLLHAGHIQLTGERRWVKFNRPQAMTEMWMANVWEGSD